MAPAPQVASITDAPEPLAMDIARRSHVYLIQMGIRVACFVGAVALDHWTRWLLVAGAVLLPYSAVVLANAGRTPDESSATFREPLALPPSGNGRIAA